MCILICLLLCWFYVCLCSYLIFLGPCSLHGYCVTTSLLYTVQGPICTGCPYSTGVCIAWHTATTVTMLQHLQWPRPSMVYGQWVYVPPGQSSNDEIFFSPCNIPSTSLSIFLYTATQCLIGFYWWSNLAEIHYLELHYACSSYPLSPAINQLQGQQQMHLFLDTRALKHHKISCMHLL